MEVQLVILSCLVAFGLTKKPVTTETQAMNHLTAYQYMGPNCPMEDMKNLEDVVAYPKALRYYQHKMGLTITGLLDDATKEMMSKDRCGVPDMISSNDAMKRRKKRFAVGEYVWSNPADLFYKFRNFSPDLNEAETDRIVAMAFKMWSDVSPLRFTKAPGTSPAQFEILFGRREHGDGLSFDGPSGVLAHAFFPESGGDIHFDDDETFTDKTAAGTNLLFVAVHEFGHSLGIRHSDVRDAIMFPTYPGYKPNLALHIDDIAAVQALYGQNTQTTTTMSPATTTTTTMSPATTTPTTGPVSQPDFCSDSSVDAIFYLNRELYVFQGDWYVKVDASGIVEGYPRRISGTFPGLPGDLDCAVHSFFNIYFLKGDQLWVYDYDVSTAMFTLDNVKSGALASIGLPNNVNMIYEWSGNGRVYAHTDDQYYRLSYFLNEIDSGYPRDVEEWGLPDIPGKPYTDALSVGRRTFFFAGDEYIRFNDTGLQADRGYPKSVGEMWFGCDESNVMSMEMNNEESQTTGVEDPVMEKDTTSGAGHIQVSFVLAFLVVFGQATNLITTGRRSD